MPMPLSTEVLSREGVDLDPDIARFIAMISESYNDFPALNGLPPEDVRPIAAQVRAPWAEGGPVMVRTEDHTVTTEGGTVKVRLFDPLPPSAALKPVFVYVHGGGWMLFSIDTHDRVMREYAQRAGMVVIGVDYSHAPQARFPVALNEVLATVRWVRDQGESLGVDSNRMAIGGDSVGGNMSVATALSLRDSGEGDVLKALVLNYGAFDDAIAPEFTTRYGGPRYMLTPTEMEVFWANYIHSDTQRKNPLVVPMRGDMHALPPAFFAIPECDILRGQSHDLAARFKEAGVRAESVIYAGASHSFLEAVSIAEVASKAFDDGANWLRRHLGIPR